VRVLDDVVVDVKKAEERYAQKKTGRGRRRCGGGASHVLLLARDLNHRSASAGTDQLALYSTQLNSC